MAYMSLIIYIFLDKLWLCRFYSFCILILCSGCVGLATWLNKPLMRLLLNLIALMKSPTRTAPLLCSFFGIISPCGPRIYRRREVNAINFSLPSLLEASVNFLFIYLFWFWGSEVLKNYPRLKIFSLIKLWKLSCVRNQISIWSLREQACYTRVESIMVPIVHSIFFFSFSCHWFQIFLSCSLLQEAYRSFLYFLLYLLSIYFSFNICS